MARSLCHTFRKSCGARGRDKDLPLSQYPRQSKPSSIIVFFLPISSRSSMNLRISSSTSRPICRSRIRRFLRGIQRDVPFISRWPTRAAAGDETPSVGRICDPKLPHSLKESNGIIFDVQGGGRAPDLDSEDGVNGVPRKGSKLRSWKVQAI